jgi:hypothetical protein
LNSIVERRGLCGRGDRYVQIGTCHKFTNVMPGSGWVKLFAVSQEIMPVEINEEVLKREWRWRSFH